MNIFVAKLDYNTTSDTVRDAFSEFGEVSEVKIIMDRETGRSKGFGFVEMPDDEAGWNAINNLNGVELDGREILVKKSEPRENNNRGRDNNRGGGGGYGGGGGNRRRFSRDNNRGDSRDSRDSRGGNRYDRDSRDSRDNRFNRNDNNRW